MSERVRGNLIIIGGAEDKVGEKAILKHVAGVVKERGGGLVVLTTATEKPQEVGNNYRTVFESLGLSDIDVLNINSRDEANLDENAERIINSGGVFFTGGDQLRITSILGGTKAYLALYEAYSKGVVVIGTSAGASVMSNTMVVERSEEQHV